MLSLLTPSILSCATGGVNDCLDKALSSSSLDETTQNTTDGRVDRVTIQYQKDCESYATAYELVIPFNMLKKDVT